MPAKTPTKPEQRIELPKQPVQEPPDVPREWFPRRNHMRTEEVYLALLALIVALALVVAGIWWTT